MPFPLKTKFLLAVIAAILIASPVAIYSGFVRTYGTNVLYLDQWEYVPLLEKVFTGTISFGDLFKQSNEHRNVIPKAIMLTLAYFSHYDNTVELAASFLILLASGFVLFAIFKPDLKDPMSYIKFSPLVWLLFSLRQWESALWGICVVWYCALFFNLLMIYFVGKSKGTDRFFLAGIGAAVCSTFSCAIGLVTWPAGLIMLLGKKGNSDSRIRKDIIFWILSAILITIIYMYRFEVPGRQFLINFGNDAYNDLLYFLAFTGGFIYRARFAIPLGAVLTLAYTACIYVWARAALKKDDTADRLSPYVGMMILVLLCGFFLVIMRGALGWRFALYSRYATVSSLGIAGLYMYIFRSGMTGKQKIILASFMALFIFSGYLFDCPQAFERANLIKINRTWGSYYLRSAAQKTDSDLSFLLDDPDYVRRNVGTLKKYRLSFFNTVSVPDISKLSPSFDSAEFGIDVAFKKPKEDPKDGYIVIVSGWAAFDKGMSASGGVIGLVNGKDPVPSAANNLFNPNIAKKLGNREMINSFFLLEIPDNLLKKGDNIISFYVLSGDRKHFYRPFQTFTFTI